MGARVEAQQFNELQSWFARLGDKDIDGDILEDSRSNLQTERVGEASILPLAHAAGKQIHTPLTNEIVDR